MSDSRLTLRSRLAGVATGVALALALTAARASDGTITFTGAVTGNSCTAQVSTEAASAGVILEITLRGCVASQADASHTAPARIAVRLQAGDGAERTTPELVEAASSNAPVKLYLQTRRGAVTCSLVYD